MTITKPRLIVTEAPSEKWRERWNALTQEERKRMTPAELIKAMGPLHCQHKDYKERPVPLIPMPNLAGKQPVISRHDYGIFAQWRGVLRWVME